MNDSASGKVKGAKSAYPSSHAPYPVCYRVIDNCRPENTENHHCAELHPVCKGSRYQCWCDYGKHHLEYHEYRCRYRCSIIRVRRCSHTIESKPLKTSDQTSSRIRAKCKTVSKKHPLDADKGKNYEALHNDRQDTLFPDHPAIEKP